MSERIKTYDDHNVDLLESMDGMLKQPNSAFDKQVGGDHYGKMKIQPVEYCHVNRDIIGPTEAGVIKYVSRHRFKNGKQDILKAIHLLELILEMDYKDE